MQSVVTIDPACGMDPRVAAFGVAALDKQAQEFARDWGIPYVPVVYHAWDVLMKMGDGPELLAFIADSWMITIEPDIGDPTMLGYHVMQAGIAYSRCQCPSDHLDWTTAGHENMEMTKDPTCNLWAPGGREGQQAVEVSDRCEGDSYIESAQIGPDSMAIRLSNYLLPTAFQPNSVGPWDRMGTLKAWDEVRPGGYEIVLDAAGNTSNVFARVGRVGVDAHATLVGKMQRHDSRVMRRLRGAWAP